MQRQNRVKDAKGQHTARPQNALYKRWMATISSGDDNSDFEGFEHDENPENPSYKRGTATISSGDDNSDFEGFEHDGNSIPLRKLNGKARRLSRSNNTQQSAFEGPNPYLTELNTALTAYIEHQKEIGEGQSGHSDFTDAVGILRNKLDKEVRNLIRNNMASEDILNTVAMQLARETTTLLNTLCKEPDRRIKISKQDFDLNAVNEYKENCSRICTSTARYLLKLCITAAGALLGGILGAGVGFTIGCMTGPGTFVTTTAGLTAGVKAGAAIGAGLGALSTSMTLGFCLYQPNRPQRKVDNIVEAATHHIQNSRPR